MKVDVKKLDTITRELKFQIPKEMVSEKMQEVYKDIAKNAKIKGFRPGKAPKHILESHYGDLAKEEVLKQLIPEAYQSAVVREKLAPIDMPDILDVSFKDGIVAFTARIEIKPEVNIKDYKGLKVKRKSSKVTDDDMKKTLEYFKAGQGKDKDVTIDDDFAKGLGYPNLEEFKKSLTRQLEIDKDRQNRIDVENQVVDSLLKKTKVLAPQSLVNKQLAKRLEETQNRLKSSGLPEEEVKKKEEDMKSELKTAVEKDVKVYLILDKIAELENIEIKEGENLPYKVMEFLLKEAKWEEAKKNGN